MRAISPHPRYSIQLIEADIQMGVDDAGHIQQVTRRKNVLANFQQGGILPWEYEAALTHFSFSGIPEGVNPLTRISHFDTEAYAAQNDLPPGQIDHMEERLVKLAELNPSQFIIVDKPRRLAPWPSYDSDSVEDILDFQERLQVAPENVRLYEHENQGREEILTEMEYREGLTQRPADDPTAPKGEITVQA